MLKSYRIGLQFLKVFPSYLKIREFDRGSLLNRRPESIEDATSITRCNAELNDKTRIAQADKLINREPIDYINVERNISLIDCYFSRGYRPDINCVLQRGILNM